VACNIETFAYPAWWSGASTVQINYVVGGSSGPVNRADMEFLPQGVSWSTGVLVPWSNVGDIQKLT
jgi:hypothetical protein